LFTGTFFLSLSTSMLQGGREIWGEKVLRVYHLEGTRTKCLENWEKQNYYTINPLGIAMLTWRRRSQPRPIEYIVEEPRRSTHRARSRSRVRDVEVRTPRGSYVDERVSRRSVTRDRY
jgi:hypothetical protein